MLCFNQSNLESPSEEQLLQQAKEFAKSHGPILNLSEVIRNQSPRMALAAEFKRASPSKGDIATHVNCGEQAKTYAQAGAKIISVLTEQRWFKGTLADLTEARLQSTDQDGSRPAILRKEFVTERYQIAEAAAAGADTILLIVAVLPQHVLKLLIDYARNVGMEPLVEVHGDAELDVAIEAGAKVIGVNNRNLHTFQLDLGTSQHVATELAKRGLKFDHNDKDAEYSLCALSGMSTAFDVQRYRKVGLGMCLIGESLMRASDPSAAIAGLCLHPDDFEKQQAMASGGGAYTGGTKMIKVCGTTRPEDALKACQEGANLIGVIFVPKSKRCVTAEQAKEIVQTVRKFGERTKTAEFPEPSSSGSPMTSLVEASHALQEAARRPLVVGVFQNQDPDFIKQMVAECGLDMVQLHGKEGMMAANRANCGAPAIRVVDIETDPETGKATTNAVDTLLQSLTSDPMAILLDTSIKGSKEGGGTGVTFDWSIAEKIQNAGLPVIIAGGLTPDNVKDAVSSVRPWGVDVSSGLEESPGKKDHQKVHDFVRGAKDAAKEASKGF